MIRTAQIDPTGCYRYTLGRLWDETRPSVLWIMLNPSTADAEEDDPTIRRCMAFSHGWGFGALTVVNLFALRATDPLELIWPARDPVGPENDGVLCRESGRHSKTIAAWGVGPRQAIALVSARQRAVLDLLAGVPLFHLCLTKGGVPGHPLYLRGDLEPSFWSRG